MAYKQELWDEAKGNVGSEKKNRMAKEMGLNPKA